MPQEERPQQGIISERTIAIKYETHVQFKKLCLKFMMTKPKIKQRLQIHKKIVTTKASYLPYIESTSADAKGVGKKAPQLHPSCITKQ